MTGLIKNNVSLPLNLTERYTMGKETYSKPLDMPCVYTEEEMEKIVKERLQSLEDGTAELVDGEEVFSQIRARYGFNA